MTYFFLNQAIANVYSKKANNYYNAGQLEISK